jgi:hypothetical protein
MGNYTEDLMADSPDAQAANDLSNNDTADDTGDRSYEADSTGEGAAPVFNEVSCHGEDWVELLNLSEEPFDLSGWGITDDGVLENGLIFSPGSLIEAGQHLVIYRSDNAEENTIPFGVNCTDDILWLLNPQGQIDSFLPLETVREDLTWGRLPDGTGDFTETVPTPGAINRGTDDPQVLLNEVNCHVVDWIELINIGSETVDMEGWTVNEAGSGDPYLLPPYSLAPGEMLLVESGGLDPGVILDNPPEAVGFDFPIDCDGDRVTLLNSDGGLMDETTLSPLRADLTWGRLPDGEGDWRETGWTPGEPNEAGISAEIYLNEINCSGRDWVEVVNVGENTVDLGQWTFDDDEDPGGGYTLPYDSVVAPGEYLVIEQTSQGEPGFVFGIACGLDTVHLFDHNGTTVDHALSQDVLSYLTVGRLPDITGEWMPTNSTPGLPNAEPQDSAFLFDSYTVHDFELTISPDGISSLRSNPTTYVPGQMELIGSGLAPLEVGIRLKGQIGSLRTIDSNDPAFLVDINRYVDGQLFYGLEKLTLNNMVQDSTAMHEWTAYQIFRGAGVPSSRTGWARVWLNGESKGFYLQIETLDDVMLDSWFDSTSHLYEGAYGQDIDDWASLEVDEGDPLDRSDLQLIQEIRDSTPDNGRYEATLDLIDWNEATMMMGIELFIGDWDGYAISSNNWFFHTTEEGVLSIMPWGKDQTFGWEEDYFSGSGDLFEDCMDASTCRALYTQNLGIMANMINEIGLIPELQAVGESMQPYINADPLFSYSITGTIDHIEDEQEQIFCMGAIVADEDGDGITNCDGDCNDFNETVYPGALEICEDDLDNNCNARVDEGC